MPDLMCYAEDLGLNVNRSRDALRRHKYAEPAAEDLASADASGVAGTPSFFVNGGCHPGAYDVASLSSAVGGGAVTCRRWPNASRRAGQMTSTAAPGTHMPSASDSETTS
jgi:hypothetical protein